MPNIYIFELLNPVIWEGEKMGNCVDFLLSKLMQIFFLQSFLCYIYFYHDINFGNI